MNILYDDLYDKVFNLINHDYKIYTFMKRLAYDANIYLFGGAVRDYLDQNFSEIRDLDFVIEFTKPNCSIDDYLSDSLIIYKKNRFNGYKLISSEYSIDIWELKDTWAFREKIIQSSVDNLFKSVYFNIDKVLYFINERSFVKHCDETYNKIRKERILDIVLEKNPMIELNLLRAIKICQKYDMILSKQLKSVFSDYLKKSDFISKLQYYQTSHYCEKALPEFMIHNMILDLIM